MFALRRLTALVAAASFVGATFGVGVGVGVVTPAAQASPATAPSASAAAAPHDPSTYYAGTAGLSGASLAARLHTIISGHTRLTYAQLWDALSRTDVDPDRSGYLIDFYSGTSILASNQCGSSCAGGKWNREHTWPQSHGNFGTSAGIGTDLFHMRPEFGDTNSSRGNLDFDNGGSAGVPSCADCLRDSDSFQPRAGVKGDVARGLLYMAVRYEGDDGLANLKMNDLTCNGAGAPNMGKLSTLVAWSLADPPDDRERARNDLVDSDYQHNRNPFIDHPEWATSIFGNGVGMGPVCGSTTGSDYLPGGTTENQAPAATPATATTAEDTATTAALRATDADGDALTWSISRAPSNGTASVSGSTLTYTPARDFNGTDQVGVTVSDGRGGTATTTATFTVTPVNDAPVVSDVTAATTRNTSAQVSLVATDVDDAPSTLTFAVATPPAHGTATINGATVTYTPTTGYTGDDTFTFRAADPAGATSAPATVRVVVTVGPQAPVASNVSTTTIEGRPVTFTLPAGDADGDPLTYAVVAAPAHGSAQISGNQATYTPSAGFHGADSFTFTASDATSVSAPATASIAVSSTNSPPVATSGSASTAQDSSVTVTLQASDQDGDPLVYAVASQPSHGSVTITGDQATYTPATGFSGTDTFTWTVSDPEATSTGTTDVTVTRLNHAPTSAAVTATADQDGQVQVLLLGGDVDGDALTYATAAAPAHGTVTIDGVTATYTPAAGFFGADTFTYTASDGLLTSPPGTVTIAVTRANQAPTITSAPVLHVTAGSPSTLTIGATDPDGDPVTVTGVSAPAHGSTTISGARDVTYSPSVRSGSDTFVVTVADGRGGTASAQVGVDIVARAAQLTLTATSVARGAVATIAVSATGPAGPRPTGAVALVAGGKTITTLTLVDGTATFSSTATRAGSTQLTATYAGDDLFGPATSPPATQTVTRSASRLTIKAGPLERGRPGVVRVAVRTVAGLAPTGKVTLVVGKKKLTATLVKGTARFRVGALPRTTKLRVSARYAGNTQYLRGSAVRTFRL